MRLSTDEISDVRQIRSTTPDGFRWDARCVTDLLDTITALEAENLSMKRALFMILGSTPMEADGHDWITCDQPSCIFARQALSALDEAGEK